MMTVISGIIDVCHLWISFRGPPRSSSVRPVPRVSAPANFYDMSTADLWPKNDCSQINTGGKMAPVHAPSLWPRGGSWKTVFGCACACACPCATPIGSDGPFQRAKPPPFRGGRKHRDGPHAIGASSTRYLVWRWAGSRGRQSARPPKDLGKILTQLSRTWAQILLSCSSAAVWCSL